MIATRDACLLHLEGNAAIHVNREYRDISVTIPPVQEASKLTVLSLRFRSQTATVVPQLNDEELFLRYGISKDLGYTTGIEYDDEFCTWVESYTEEVTDELSNNTYCFTKLSHISATWDSLTFVRVDEYGAADKIVPAEDEDDADQLDDDDDGR
jgi:hypothetical protein